MYSFVVLCPITSRNRDSKNAKDIQRDLEEQEEYEPRIRDEQEAHCAHLAARAQERKESLAKEKLRIPTIAKWYQLMMTYASALMIVGGRLSAGLLFNHITVMGQVLEQLALKKEVLFKDAFLAYDEACRRYWKIATSGDGFRNFVLKDQMCLDFDRLTRIERENMRDTAGSGSAGVSTTAVTTPHVGKYVKPVRGPLTCYGCGETGHMERDCPRAAHKRVQALKPLAQPFTPQVVMPKQAALGNGTETGGKGGQFKGCKAGKIGKGKR